jgi:hypothetical protein
VSGNTNGWRAKAAAAEKLGELVKQYPPQKGVREYRVIKETVWQRVEAEVVQIQPVKYDRHHFESDLCI